MSAAAERAVGDLLTSLSPTVLVMGRGIPLGAESGFGVPLWWPWCLRWGMRGSLKLGWSVCAHKACVLALGM